MWITYSFINVKLRTYHVELQKNIIETDIKYLNAKNKVDKYFRTVSYKNWKGENYVSNRSYGYTVGR